MAGPWKAGDTGVHWQKNLKRADGTVVDLSGGKVPKLQVKNKADGTMAEVTGTVVNVSTGLVDFLIDSVIATAGHYEAEIEVTGSGGYKENGSTFPWPVQDQVKA